MNTSHSTTTNSKEESDIDTEECTECTSQADHLQNSPVTKISPNEGGFPDTTGAEAEFTQLCNELGGPVQMVAKKDIKWSKKDPLHFWQSLAFTLRSDELTCVAVSSFVDTLGQNKLYIASTDPLTASQQLETTEIINMFLDLKPVNEIAAKLLPRHLSYISKQVKKVLETSVYKLLKNLPNRQEMLESLFNESHLPKDLSQHMAALMFKKILSLDDIRELMNLITDNRRALKAMKGQDISEATKKMAFHLMKMVRVFEEINFIWKKVKRHQQDKSLTSLAPQFQFISLKRHAELAILKTAMDCCKSTTLYIGVSKRPCYCCSLFFKAVEENKSENFSISIVTTHGKLYGKWSRIENCFEKEFKHVWAKVVGVKSALKKQTQQQTDDNSSVVSGSSSDEDDLAKIKV